VVERLRTATRGVDAPFRGTVGPTEFRVERRIRYGNSFRPVARGRVTTGLSGARVELTLKPPTVVTVFLVLWFGLLTAAFAVILGAGMEDPRVLVFVLAPLALAALGYALAVGGFELEARRVRALLTASVTGALAPGVGRWPEGILEFGWDDVRAAGALGWAWVGVFAVSAALAVYDWELRRAGCTNAQKADPAYYCPSAGRILAVWGCAVVAIGAFMSGIWPIRRRRARLLLPILAVQLAALVALAWIAQDSAFHAHRPLTSLQRAATLARAAFRAKLTIARGIRSAFATTSSNARAKSSRSSSATTSGGSAFTTFIR